MDILKFFTIFLMCFFTNAGEINVNTSPEKASIYIRSSKTNTRKLLGTTPYVGNIERISTSMGIDTSFVLELEKEGYEKYSVLMVNTGKGDIKFVATLQAVKTVSKNLATDNVIIKLFDAQRFVRSKAYDEAVKILDGIEKDANNFSSYFEMKAGALYLKKDFSGALANYRKALSLNENNTDALAMKNYLEKVLGVKKK